MEPVFKKFDEVKELPKATGPWFGYAVLMIEYERGWGSKPDGYLIFESEAKADEYIERETKHRDGPVLDYYVNYNKIGYKEVSLKIMNDILQPPRCRSYVDNLSELK